jgi:hypothetical protein
MDAGFLDVFHDAGDIDVGAVAQAVDIDLDGVGQVAVKQQRVGAQQRVDLAGLVVGVARLDVFGHQFRHGAKQVVGQARLVADDLHGAAAEHVGRADHQREADVGGDQAGLFDRIGDAVVGLNQVELVQKLLEAVAVLGQVDHVGRGAEDRDAGLFQRVGELQRGLAAELDDDAVQRALLLFLGQDLEHVLVGQRLEIEPVGGVVVGRHGLRVAVDHDRLVARVLQREGGMAAAIVELDALADPVGAAAEDDDLLAVGRTRASQAGCRQTGSRRSSTCRRWARRIRRRRCRCACRPGARPGAPGLATSWPRLPVSEPSRASEKPIALILRRFSASSGRPCSRMRASMVDDLLDLGQEPGIDLADRVHLLALMPSRMAWATMRSRSGVGVPMAALMALLSSPSPRPGISISSSRSARSQARAAPSAGFRRRSGRWP